MPNTTGPTTEECSPQSTGARRENGSGRSDRDLCPHSLDVSPSGKIATCRLCGFVGRWRDGTWEKVREATDAAPPNAPPFVVSEYVALPGDRVMYVACDPRTGIMCCGREDRTHAEGDATALNAAYLMGRHAAALDHESSTAIAKAGAAPACGCDAEENVGSPQHTPTAPTSPTSWVGNELCNRRVGGVE